MVSNGTLSLFLSFWQVYWLRQLHASARWVGPLLGLLILELSFGLWVSRFIGTKVPGVLSSGIGALLIGLGAITIACGTETAFFLGQIILEVGLGIESGSAMVWIHDWIPPSLRASGLSAIGTVGGLAAIVTPTMGGWVITHGGYGEYWVVMAILAFGNAILLGFIERTRHRENRAD